MCCRMDNSDTLAVRFHFGGSFQSIDGLILYVGGDIGMSYIELDKISLPEIKGHLDRITSKLIMLSGCIG